jgi:hypothetical protein
VRHNVEIDQLIPLLRPNKNLKMLWLATTSELHTFADKGCI